VHSQWRGRAAATIQNKSAAVIILLTGALEAEVFHTFELALR
jgi:hypothetical protein